MIFLLYSPTTLDSLFLTPDMWVVFFFHTKQFFNTSLVFYNSFLALTRVKGSVSQDWPPL